MKFSLPTLAATAVFVVAIVQPDVGSAQVVRAADALRTAPEVERDAAPLPDETQNLDLANRLEDVFVGSRFASTPSGKTPRGALWRAAVLPGWGQAYNRQYVKLPFVYAALGGLTATIIVLNDRYLLYRHAYQYKAYEEITEDGEINPRAAFESDYEKLLERRGVSDLSSLSIRPTRDALRRNRDLAIIGTGLVFGLTVLDAYVSAHLMDFDISDDLTVSVHPAGRGMRTTMLLRL